VLNSTSDGDLELHDSFPVEDMSTAGLRHLQELAHFSMEPSAGVRSRYLNAWLNSGDDTLALAGLHAVTATTDRTASAMWCP